jgi:hypothetical protein
MRLRSRARIATCSATLLYQPRIIHRRVGGRTYRSRQPCSHSRRYKFASVVIAVRDCMRRVQTFVNVMQMFSSSSFIPKDQSLRHTQVHYSLWLKWRTKKRTKTTTFFVT